jgi:hypothetical protein
MRVLNPGPGEIIDRLTVVARKIVEGGERAKHFEVEMEELLTECERLDLEEVNRDFAKNCYTLAAINAAIWQREDELRKRPRGVVKLAFRIQELNDQRARLVKEINSTAGIEREEKL